MTTAAAAGRAARIIAAEPRGGDAQVVHENGRGNRRADVVLLELRSLARRNRVVAPEDLVLVAVGEEDRQLCQVPQTIG